MKKSIFALILAVAVAVLSSCDSNKFKVDGKIAGATDSTQLILEATVNGDWIPIDTVTPKGDGSFALTCEAPGYPNIYRLRIGNDAICFPIDSLDHITINSDVKQFAQNYTLSGSEHAKQVMDIDKKAMSLAGGKGSPEQIKAWKDELAKLIVSDPSGIVAYYTVNKYIDGHPLFDPTDDSDLRIVGAVANAFHSFRPNDPRTDYLVQVLLEGQQRRRAQAGNGRTLEVEEASLIDIKLQDYHGVNQVLSEVAAKNRVVLLNFTMYSADFSPVLNKLLNDLYTTYKDKGLAIYQIAYDEDAVASRMAAQNLPWITVYDYQGQNSPNAGAYQVMVLPTTFIIRNGDIVQRVEDISQLKDAVAKNM